MNAVPRRIALALLPLALTACETGQREPLFPLEGGRRWQYVVTTTYEDASREPVRERMDFRTAGTATVEGAPAYRRITPHGASYWLRIDDTGVYRVASQGPLDEAPRPDAAARYVLKKPYVVGTAWEASTTPYVLQRRNEVPRELRHLPRYRVLPMKYRIEKLDQRVTTPAGEFSGCLQVGGVAVIRLYVDEQLDYREVPITTQEWYCPGVGLVKQERVENSPTRFILGGSVRLELAAWN